MKKILVALLVFVGINGLNAQDQSEPGEIRTLFGGVQSHGFYFGLSSGYSSIDSRDAVLMGGRVAWIINHRFAMGFMGNGFISQFKYDNVLGKDANFAGGNGGIFFEPIFFPESPVHFSVPILIGGGGVAYAKKTDNYDWDNDRHHDLHVEDAAPFMFVKPGIELELNVIKFMRLSVGAYYMQTSKISMDYGTSDMMNGFSGMVTLKFGKF